MPAQYRCNTCNQNFTSHNPVNGQNPACPNGSAAGAAHNVQLLSYNAISNTGPMRRPQQGR